MAYYKNVKAIHYVYLTYSRSTQCTCVYEPALVSNFEATIDSSNFGYFTEIGVLPWQC